MARVGFLLCFSALKLVPQFYVAPFNKNKRSDRQSIKRNGFCLQRPYQILKVEQHIRTYGKRKF